MQNGEPRGPSIPQSEFCEQIMFIGLFEQELWSVPGKLQMSWVFGFESLQSAFVSHLMQAPSKQANSH